LIILFSRMTIAAAALPVDSAPPNPPCSGAPRPAYPVAVSGSVAQVWKGDDIPAGWIPPACTGWTPSKFRTLVGLAGRFPHHGGVEKILSRFASVSAWKTIRYWSVTDHAPRALLTDAAALTGRGIERRRSDFDVEEMEAGKDLFVSQVDSRSSSGVTYRMRVLESRPGRIVIAMENVSAVKALRLTLFNPGDLQSAFFFDELEPGVWGYYSLAGTRDSASVLTGGHEASLVNRAAALYEHFTGLPGLTSAAVRR
jgi:hypothetical protein